MKLITNRSDISPKKIDPSITPTMNNAFEVAIIGAFEHVSLY